MTYIEIFTALLLLGLFISGFSQALLPVYKAWEKAMIEYRTVNSLQFIYESFKNECTKNYNDTKNLERLLSTVKELQSYEITELKKGNLVYALKLSCIISGEYTEITGACVP